MGKLVGGVWGSRSDTGITSSGSWTGSLGRVLPDSQFGGVGNLRRRRLVGVHVLLCTETLPGKLCELLELLPALQKVLSVELTAYAAENSNK